MCIFTWKSWTTSFNEFFFFDVWLHNVTDGYLRFSYYSDYWCFINLVKETHISTLKSVNVVHITPVDFQPKILFEKKKKLWTNFLTPKQPRIIYKNGIDDCTVLLFMMKKKRGHSFETDWIEFVDVWHWQKKNERISFLGKNKNSSVEISWWFIWTPAK